MLPARARSGPWGPGADAGRRAGGLQQPAPACGAAHLGPAARRGAGHAMCPSARRVPGLHGAAAAATGRRPAPAHAEPPGRPLDAACLDHEAGHQRGGPEPAGRQPARPHRAAHGCGPTGRCAAGRPGAQGRCRSRARPGPAVAIAGRVALAGGARDRGRHRARPQPVQARAPRPRPAGLRRDAGVPLQRDPRCPGPGRAAQRSGAALGCHPGRGPPPAALARGGDRQPAGPERARLPRLGRRLAHPRHRAPARWPIAPAPAGQLPAPLPAAARAAAVRPRPPGRPPAAPGVGGAGWCLAGRAAQWQHPGGCPPHRPA